MLGSAIFLVLVIAAFIGAARYVKHRLLKNLPAKLGINVQSDANGWTASRSIGPITIYRVHAAKWERRTDGTMALHNVSILLYGKKGQIYEGIQELERAIDLYPRHFAALKNLAVLYEKAGFKNKAVEMWGRCAATAPDEATRTTIKQHLLKLI